MALLLNRYAEGRLNAKRQRNRFPMLLTEIIRRYESNLRCVAKIGGTEIWICCTPNKGWCCACSDIVTVNASMHQLHLCHSSCSLIDCAGGIGHSMSPKRNWTAGSGQGCMQHSSCITSDCHSHPCQLVPSLSARVLRSWTFEPAFPTPCNPAMKNFKCL